MAQRQLKDAATPHHNREHNIHPILVYGFDEDREVYHCKCFCVERGVYSADITIEEYHKALEQAIRMDLHINDDDMFCFFKIRNDIKYDFSMGSFVNELYDYILFPFPCIMPSIVGRITVCTFRQPHIQAIRCR